MFLKPYERNIQAIREIENILGDVMYNNFFGENGYLPNFFKDNLVCIEKETFTEDTCKYRKYVKSGYNTYILSCWEYTPFTIPPVYKAYTYYLLRVTGNYVYADNLKICDDNRQHYDNYIHTKDKPMYIMYVKKCNN